MADAKSFNDEVAEAGNKRHAESHLRPDVYTLEPDMIDSDGNRYMYYDRYMEATDGITDEEVIANDVSIFTV